MDYILTRVFLGHRTSSTCILSTEVSINAMIIDPLSRNWFLVWILQRKELYAGSRRYTVISVQRTKASVGNSTPLLVLDTIVLLKKITVTINF